ncbi:uncharacterized protein [Malus domestica]|uniref:uncharacterized protein isoform X2 n=1 Tax=Malus domestica TaxID=3750 RepID=UPI003974D023
MSLSLLSDLSQLPHLFSQPRTYARTHLPCARKTPHRRHLVLLPLCPVLQPQKTRKGTPASSYFPGEDEIEAGCKHTQLRRPRGYLRPSPAVPRRKEGAIINGDSVISSWYSFAPSVYGLRIEAYNPGIQALPHWYFRVLSV